ncbi:MAG: FecCD family ABC transporter permease [Culicoidibacterales bacterium]
MNKKIVWIVSFCLVAVAIGLFVAVSAGAKNISFSTVIASIFDYQSELEMQLVRDIRIPRALSTLLVGGLLGMSGAMMQGVTRNPIAEPSLMGITQGATLAIAIGYAIPSFSGLFSTSMAAFIGAMLSGGIVLIFTMQQTRSMNVSRLLLAGTALSTFFISLASVIALLTNRSQNLAFWISGGFRTADWQSVQLLFIIGGLCTIAALLLAPKINIVNLGEDVAIGLGENPIKIRILTLLLIIPMCAISVSVAGNIAFVGLIVPHMIRKVVGQDYRIILPLSFLLGGALLVWSDVLARLVDQPYETPIGLFTTLIGVPFFIWMVRKERSV